MHRPVIGDDHEADQEGEVLAPVVAQLVQELAVGHAVEAGRHRESQRQQGDRDRDHGVGEEDDPLGRDALDLGIVESPSPSPSAGALAAVAAGVLAARGLAAAGPLARAASGWRSCGSSDGAITTATPGPRRPPRQVGGIRRTSWQLPEAGA